MIVADEQVSGRGRMQRSWYSPKGKSLSVSILFDADGAISDAQILVKVTSLAMLSALNGLYSLKVDVKWPNDLEIGAKKLAGVLAEVLTKGSNIQVVVGVGVNLSQSAQELAPLVRPATSIALERPDLGFVSPQELLEAFLNSLSAQFSIARSQGGRTRILEGYRDRCTTLGQSVEVQLPSGQVIVGKAIDLGDNGELVVDTGSKRFFVSAGDVERLSIGR